MRRSLLLILIGCSIPALASSAAAKGIGAASLADKAEKLVEQLELERAKELLESAVRDPRLDAETAKARARVWVVLGRARAELADMTGMKDAFEQAVRLDPKVALRRPASPKIKEALDQARRSAVAKIEGKRRAKTRERPPETKSTKSATASIALDVASIRFRFEGVPRERAKIRIVAELEHVPPRAEIIARVRIAPTTRFLERRMIRTGTIASSELELGPEEHAVVLEARMEGRTIARAGSEDAPFRIVIQKLPSIERVQAEPTPPTPPSPRAPVTPAPAEPSEDSGPELWLFLGAGATLVLAATVATLVLATGSSSECEAERGFGCADIRVVP
ncbi:MAG: hypothetical protein HYV07_09290 [Deltaproteobacteria bacterium]|nr:hypothetical protein [Deltaproteobacteria bacterium]